MKILLIGASGTIGHAVAAALTHGHEIVSVSRTTTPLRVDIASHESIMAMLRQAGPVDAVICTTGAARFKPMAQLEDDDFAFSIENKLMGQVNVIRTALNTVRDGGSITVTSGILAHTPSAGSGAISLVNAGLEGFMRAAALEAPRGIRVNAVSPPWVSETLKQMGMDPGIGLPAAEVAHAYVRAVEGGMTGEVIEV